MKKKPNVKRINKNSCKVFYHGNTTWVPRSELLKVTRALNKIAIIGSGELAYSSEFTNKVMAICRKALGIKDTFTK